MWWYPVGTFYQLEVTIYNLGRVMIVPSLNSFHWTDDIGFTFMLMILYCHKKQQKKTELIDMIFLNLGRYDELYRSLLVVNLPN